jgi:hypothetical protein
MPFGASWEGRESAVPRRGYCLPMQKSRQSAISRAFWKSATVDKIIALFSLHLGPTPVETAPSNGAAGSWSAPDAVAKFAAESVG